MVILDPARPAVSRYLASPTMPFGRYPARMRVVVCACLACGNLSNRLSCRMYHASVPAAEAALIPVHEAFDPFMRNECRCPRLHCVAR
jgi:hypothetical protein